MLKDRDITAMARPHLIAPALLYLSRRWEVLCFLLMLTLLYLLAARLVCCIRRLSELFRESPPLRFYSGVCCALLLLARLS